MDGDTRPAAPPALGGVVPRRGDWRLLRSLAFVCLVCALAPVPAAALDEPTEKELRRAYLDFLYDFVALQGDPLDPGCSLEGSGCTVRLLDVRRDYRLVSFRKIACYPAEPAGFACSFEAKVTCAYTAKGGANTYVGDLYCEPVFNKLSTYVAQLAYTAQGWLITRFLQG